jgi:hypothetical protein
LPGIFVLLVYKYSLIVSIKKSDSGNKKTAASITETAGLRQYKQSIFIAIKKSIEDDTTVQKIERRYLFSCTKPHCLCTTRGEVQFLLFKFPPQAGVRLNVCETQAQRTPSEEGFSRRFTPSWQNKQAD